MPSSTTEVHISDDCNIIGIDCIWQNMYCDTTFRLFRKWQYCDLDSLLVLIMSHVQKGFYTIEALNATKHTVVVTVVCLKNFEELPDGWHNVTNADKV
mgnify:CR=1